MALPFLRHSVYSPVIGTPQLGNVLLRFEISSLLVFYHCENGGGMGEMSASTFPARPRTIGVARIFPAGVHFFSSPKI